MRRDGQEATDEEVAAPRWEMQAGMRDLEFLAFDVFGTVVNWRSSIARELKPFLLAQGLSDLDPFGVADEWRGLYQPSMDRVRSGEREWVPLSTLNRENLEKVLAAHGLDAAAVPDSELQNLNRAWERLDPWPDSVEGLRRLRTRYPVGTLSNGHIAGMFNLARHAGLTWDAILGAEIARNYKPSPETYLRSVEAVGLHPNQVGMVAAHNKDLKAARQCGLRTVFVLRPTEHGPNQLTDLAAAADWDICGDSLQDIADKLGC
jgi:2-haloacid dehalogenase